MTARLPALPRRLVRTYGVCFGQVRTRTRGITANAILGRRLAGESAAFIADDYGIDVRDVRAVEAWVERLVYGQRARRAVRKVAK